MLKLQQVGFTAWVAEVERYDLLGLGKMPYMHENLYWDPRDPHKSWSWQCVPVISVLTGQRQENTCSFLANQSSEVQIQ